MAKYSIARVQECEAWIAEHGLMDYGGARLQDYCAAMSISDKTHRKWLDLYPEYKAAVKEGYEAYKRKHTKALFGTLMEAALGGERDTVSKKTEFRPDPENNGRPKIAKQVEEVTKQYIKPDVAAAIFLICNLDPDHYQNRQKSDVTIRKPDELEEMSIDDINDEIARLSKLELDAATKQQENE
jgi:hypothetical protein